MPEMHHPHSSGRTLILVLMISLGITGCAPQTGVLNVDHPQDIFWPSPPDKKRILFLQAISGPADLNINPGLLTRVFRYIGGKNELSIVSPYGVTLDADGRLYVVDAFLHGVHVFDAGANKYSVFPADSTTLPSPVDIAVDDAGGIVFVTDSKKGVVKIFKDQGKHLQKTFGGEIFKRPTGIAINRKTGELLVVDTLQSRVFRFDLSSLAQKGSFGGRGESDGRFHYPTLISVTSAGDIIVSDALNFRVQVFSPEGRFLYKIGGMGNSPGTFSRPKGVASDSDGNIYVIDAIFDNIQVFDSQGRLLTAFGTHGSGPGEFGLPAGIHIDQNDLIYISDSSNRRVQVFQYLKEEATQ
jgi:DNA-binding beta-propeller fold protein YncE